MASVPFSAPYVDAVLPADAVRVGPPTMPSPWLDPDHLLASAADVDVLHVHAGYEGMSARQLEAWTAAVRRSGVPLVVTVHQLRAGRDGSRSRSRFQLRALLATAEVVLTLTPGAADEIADRFGRTAIVVAHPSLAAPTPGIGRETRLVGLHLGSLESQAPEAAGLVRGALSGALSGGGRLRVDVHPGVDPAAGFPELLALADAGDLELHRSTPRTPAEWVRHLQEVHVSVLPDLALSHSSWVELCRDAGTRVVIPSGGHQAGQWSDVVVYGSDAATGLDPTSLSTPVVAALTRPSPGRVDAVWRAEQRDAVRAVHAQVYEQVAADRVPA
nr:glycosyltransferase [Modestobacter sp. DSM 44400]